MLKRDWVNGLGAQPSIGHGSHTGIEIDGEWGMIAKAKDTITLYAASKEIYVQ